VFNNRKASDGGLRYRNTFDYGLGGGGGGGGGGAND
jgi:hypothetical protein